MPEEDSLMQELLEIQQQQDSQARHLVVTLDGDLGSSFIEYLNQEAKQVAAANKSEGRLEDGI